MTPISKSPTLSKSRCLLASLTVESENLLGGSAPDNDGIDHDKSDTFNPWLPSPSTTDVLSLVKISVDENLQHRLHALCIEFGVACTCSDI